MSSDYSKQYADFIGALEKLFHIKSNEPIEDMCSIITNTLISKYQLTINQLTKLIREAIRYNYASGANYVKILEQIGADLTGVSDYHFETEGSIKFIVMHDQIDKFKEYLTQNSISGDIFLKIPNFVYNAYHYLKFFAELSLIEACAYFGSVNIFYFLISNQISEITERCFSYAVIGGNQDIINECLKKHKMDIDCLRSIIRAHNHELLEYVLDREIFELDDLYGEDWGKAGNCMGDANYRPIYKDIIRYQNLNAVFLLFKRNKYYIFPWGAVFPQTIDIFKNNTFSNKHNHTKCEIIYFACKSKNSDICRLLLESYNQNIVNNNEGDDECISHGIYISEKDKYRKTALYYAAKYNSKETAELLIAHGIDFSEKDNDGYTALHFAARYNSKETAELLISHGININEKDKYGRTALHIAAIYNRKETAELLISHGINIIEKDNNGETALHHAARYNNKETAELLISHGANIIEKDKYGATALHHAARYNNKETAELLISHGANIIEKDNNGATALHHAARYNNKETAELLISHGININEKDKYGRTALHIAASNNSKETAELLISHGINISEKDEYGQTALHHAARYNNKETAELLISHGINIIEKDNNGATALHIAAIYNSKETAKLLISHGIDISEKDNDGATALYYAAKYNNKETAELLRVHLKICDIF
ncbi:ankyrin repeat protein, putative [Trichomonas vaginalis G3]|uniref:Ankyrin repeat protein, putative n=1 Tax=Trichomonas vaginalis (strain ATCC PRA-98 / G3) TaxID=412133 RepID=A2DC97_TRIV3|nr:cyclin-dependent kinase inhibitor 2C-related family [Trichomonas vaginalis G3]EAY21834.1 ankyrin repeat protein, putative [Trichomonas vaginalis G3]KAI5487696.1 cyclin-dependent kinase inhibitor 2C-related family [Trichomonas vaginalis G3]|eukprot:XP_001582820.1 ankyrin repeat protein [Trichomonas vaginalis G3]